MSDAKPLRDADNLSTGQVLGIGMLAFCAASGAAGLLALPMLMLARAMPEAMQLIALVLS